MKKLQMLREMLRWRSVGAVLTLKEIKRSNVLPRRRNKKEVGREKFQERRIETSKRNYRRPPSAISL